MSAFQRYYVIVHDLQVVSGPVPWAEREVLSIALVDTYGCGHFLPADEALAAKCMWPELGVRIAPCTVVNNVPPRTHRRGPVSFEITTDGIVATYVQDPRPINAVRAELIAADKIEAGKRIEQILPDWMGMRQLRGGAPIPADRQKQAAEIADAQNAREAWYLAADFDTLSIADLAATRVNADGTPNPDGLPAWPGEG